MLQVVWSCALLVECFTLLSCDDNNTMYPLQLLWVIAKRRRHKPFIANVNYAEFGNFKAERRKCINDYSGLMDTLGLCMNELVHPL